MLEGLEERHDPSVCVFCGEMFKFANVFWVLRCWGEYQIFRLFNLSIKVERVFGVKTDRLH